MVRIATNRAISQQRKAHWLETRNGIRNRLRPLAYEIFSYGWSKVQPDPWEWINVSLRMASVSPNSFTFTTDPGHVLYPATIRKPNLFESLNSFGRTLIPQSPWHS